MKKLCLIFMLFSFSCAGLFSQESDYRIPFSVLKERKEAYFAALVEANGAGILEAEAGEYREYKRWLAFWEPRIAPDGTYESYSKTIYDYYQGQKKRSSANSTKALGNTDSWTELGPFKKPNPGLSSVGNGDLGVGIIEDVVINTQNADRVLGWSLAGGLYVTDNKGLNWQNAGSDNWLRSGCSSADFSPVDQDTWYGCGNIGGSYYNNSIGYSGGVHRTTDAGLTWDQIAFAPQFTYDTYQGETVINKIKIHPLNPSIAFVATRTGLYRGDNVDSPTVGAITWTPIHSGHIDDMEFRTNASGTLVISTRNSSGAWTIESTTDNGVNWTLLTALPIITPPAGYTNTTHNLVLEVSDAAPGSLYVWQKYKNVSATAEQKLTKLYKYTFSTATWQLLSNPVWQGPGPAFCVSNFDPNIIYIGQNDLSFAKSTNGGASFVAISNTPTTTNQFHVDIESLRTPPSTCSSCSSELYITTHGGVSYTNDNCATISSRCDGLGIGSGLGVSSATNPEKMMIGLDHDGTVMSSGNYEPGWVADWETVFDGDGMPPVIDYSDPNYTWAAWQTSAHYLSSAGGTANTYVHTDFSISNDFVGKMYQNKVYPEIIYCREANNAGGLRYEDLYRSTNRAVGGVKEQLSDFASTIWQDGLTHEFWMFEVYPTVDANVAYTSLSTNGVGGVWLGKLFRNTAMMSSAATVMSSWVDMQMPPNMWAGGAPHNSFHCAGIDCSNPNIMYLGYNASPNWNAAQLWKTDYTNPSLPTFINIAGQPYGGGLPFISIRAIVTEKGSNGGIYVATDVGIFYSNNSMLDFTSANNSQWIKLGVDLPNVPVISMEINYVVNKLRIATAGRGMWEHDLYCPADDFLTFTNHPASDSFYEAVNYITSSATAPANNNTDYRAGTYIDLTPGFTAAPATGKYFKAFIHPCSYPGNSPFRENLETPNELTDKEMITDGKFICYPNPSNGSFSIVLSETQICDIQIFDLMGKRVYERKNCKEKKIDIDLPELKSGMYIVQVSNGRERQMQKLIKE
jgi:hypothetical protein